ncbi:MAG: pseudouridine synthase, partial [Brachybacterium tyrofermentans]
MKLRDDQGSPRPKADRSADGDGPDLHQEGAERLQKILARAGFGSRRACETLISTGRVMVDGAVVSEQGIRIEASAHVIHVDGRRLQLDDAKVTVVLNKPRHVVSAMSDPEGRRDLAEFTAPFSQRLYHVGRLDYETEGLLLLTNDGELAHRLTHPSFEVEKTYV